jgi:hypothetical protein
MTLRPLPIPDRDPPAPPTCPRCAARLVWRGLPSEDREAAGGALEAWRCSACRLWWGEHPPEEKP